MLKQGKVDQQVVRPCATFEHDCAGIESTEGVVEECEEWGSEVTALQAVYEGMLDVLSPGSMCFSIALPQVEFVVCCLFESKHICEVSTLRCSKCESAERYTSLLVVTKRPCNVHAAHTLNVRYRTGCRIALVWLAYHCNAAQQEPFT